MSDLNAILSIVLQGKAGSALAILRKSILVGLGVGVATGLFSLTLPNEYQSDARILPADQRAGGGLGAAFAAAAAVGVSIPGQESADIAYVDILNSRYVREAVLNTVYTFRLKTWYFGREQTRQQTLYQFIDKPNMDRALSVLRSKITITRDFKTKLLSISVKTQSPELSQQIVRRMVCLLEEFVVNKSQTKGGSKALFSKKRLDEARKEMKQAEDAFRMYLDVNRNYLMSPDPGVRLHGMRLENELKLRTQLVTTLTIGLEQALLEEKNDMPILNVLDAGNLPFDKTGPARVFIVIIYGFVTSLVTLLYLRRDWIIRRLGFQG